MEVMSLVLTVALKKVMSLVKFAKKLRQMNEEAGSEMSNDKKDLEKASKQLRDFEKDKRRLDRKLKGANKRVRSRSEPAP